MHSTLLSSIKRICIFANDEQSLAAAESIIVHKTRRKRESGPPQLPPLDPRARSRDPHAKVNLMPRPCLDNPQGGSREDAPFWLTLDGRVRSFVSRGDEELILPLTGPWL